MNYSFECSITPFRNNILELEDKVKEFFTPGDEKLKDQICMAAMELLENAEKYSKAMHGESNIHFKFNANDTQISIMVTSLPLTPEYYSNLVEILNQINTTDNIEALYIRRLQYLTTNLDLNESGLGLYRIAYEGDFKLSHSKTGDFVTILAEKQLT